MYQGADMPPSPPSFQAFTGTARGDTDWPGRSSGGKAAQLRAFAPIKFTLCRMK